MPLKSGEIFAGFRILRLLGSGGMGEVYLGQHPRLPRLYALKVLPRDVSGDADYRERFNREADLAATLYHPNIVGVHDRGNYNGQLWISMDFIEGADAGHVLRQRYPTGMPTHEAFKIITAVANALDYAHECGLLHRDVKPTNILVSEPNAGAGRIMLADFGIARRLHEVSGLTATNVAIGTISYGAPEQLLGEALDGRADQYALAVTAYHLLAGTLPFDHSSPVVVIGQHLNATPPTLASRRPELARLDPVFAIGLAKDHKDRFPKCADFARALMLEHAGRSVIGKPSHPTAQAPGARERLKPPSPTKKRPTSPLPITKSGNLQREAANVSGSPRRRHTTVGAIVVLLLLLAVVFAGRLWHQERATEGTTSTPTSAAPSMTFDAMGDFVTEYYNDLPAHPENAWAKVRNHTGQPEFVDFWTKIQSVTLISVSPRDAASVIARLRYVRRDGLVDTEDRWLRMVIVDGAMLVDGSGRIAAVN